MTKSESKIKSEKKTLVNGGKKKCEMYFPKEDQLEGFVQRAEIADLMPAPTVDWPQSSAVCESLTFFESAKI